MRFLLDTNILLSLLRGSPLYKKVEHELNLKHSGNSILISSVSKGELMALGTRNNWGAAKIRLLDDLLNRLIIIDIVADNQALFETYSQMDCYSQNALPGNPLPHTHSARKMGKNDLWIAATAYLTNSALVTTDRDFDNLAGRYIDLRYYDVAS